MYDADNRNELCASSSSSYSFKKNKEKEKEKKLACTSKLGCLKRVDHKWKLVIYCTKIPSYT